MARGEFVERARLLFQQTRYELASRELRQQLVDDPSDAYAHSLLALSLNHLSQPKEAFAHAAEGVRFAPESPYSHYAMAFLLARHNRHKQAEAAINEALRLNPREADYFDLLARIRLDQANWSGALDAANRGLALQADHIGCVNARGRALIKMGRRADALETVDSALRLEPDNARSHANKGWTLVESGDSTSALEHFREALRLEPDLAWARQGLVTALKAQNPVYRVMLGYFLWMARLPPTIRRGVIIGLWLAAQLNGAIRRAYPALAPLCEVLSVLYILFCWATWTADPLFNMLLRFNRFGRYALTQRQIVQSNWVAGVLLVSLLALLTYFIRPQGGYLVLTIGGFLLVVCAGLVFRSGNNFSLRLCSILMASASVLVAAVAILSGL